MKTLNTITTEMVAIVISILLSTATVISQELTIDHQNSDKIVFNTPSLKCGELPWDDPIIQNWLKNYCIEKCDDPDASGYAFSGKILVSDKSNSLKVTITTNKDYAQPVRFNPIDGTFKGTLYFDKSIQEKTVIKLLLRDSTRAVINTFIITLTD